MNRTATPRRSSLIVLAAITVLLVLMLAACGQSQQIALNLESATVELIRGSQVAVAVSLTPAGSAGAGLTLGVDGLPANVTATFVPATLSSGDPSSVLTLTSTGAAAEGTYDLTVTATGASSSATAPLVLEVASLSVAGQVVDLVYSPIAGVSVGSQGQTTTSATDGGFTLTGLAVPYDLSLWSTADSWVNIYEGLTVSELVIRPLEVLSGTDTVRSTTITGSLLGASIPVGANQGVRVCAEPMNRTDGVQFLCTMVGTGESNYSLVVQWRGRSSIPIKLHALQLETDASNVAVGYPGYGTMDLTITDGSPVTGANVQLNGPLETANVAVTVDAGVAVAATAPAVRVGPNLTVLTTTINSPATNLYAVMPVIEGATYQFVSAAVVSSSLGWQAGVAGDAATVPLPAPASLLAPADAATGVTAATEFSVDAVGGTPITYSWSEGGAGSLHIEVTTTSTTLTLPDLGDYGLSIPAGASFTWGAVVHHGLDPADVGVAPLPSFLDVLYMVLSGGSTGLTGSGAFISSVQWGFTMAP